MATVKADPQAGIFDRTIEDLEFEAALRELQEFDGDEEFQEHLKAMRKAKSLVKQKCEFHNLQSDERMRVGDFVITGKERNGGGFEVPGWTSVIPASIEEVRG